MIIRSICTVILVTGLIASCNSKSDKKTGADTTVVTNPVGAPDTTRINNTSFIDVPVNTRTDFEQKFPQASRVVWNRYSMVPEEIEWEWYGWPMLDTSDYVANFYINDNPYWVWYDQDGNWVGAIETVPVANVPDAVNKSALAKYPGYTVESVNKENDKNRVAYEIKLKKGDDWVKLLVAENGDILKSKTKTDGVKSKEKSS